MFERIGLRPAVVCAALLMLGQVASAQLKVGVVNMQRAVFESAEIKKADADMQTRYKPRADRAQALQGEIAAIAQQLQAGAGKLTQEAEADLNAEGARKQRELTRMNEDMQADVERERNEILGKSSQKMTDVVKKLAESKGLDLVVDSGQALYFKPSMDITDDAIAAYDKAYPVTAAAPASAAAPAPAAKK
jgi:outer membrane protein